MFVKNKIIDNNKIQEVIESRNLLTYDSIMKDWHDVLEMSNELETELGTIEIKEPEIKDEEFSFYELYDIEFRGILYGLTLDELEYIIENNCFNFDENNILDYRCKMNINRIINYYKQIVSDLINCMQKETIGSYFQRFGDLFHMSAHGLEIATFLGLNRDGVELTPEGKKLKTCIDNIRQLHIDELKQRATVSKHSPSSR